MALSKMEQVPGAHVAALSASGALPPSAPSAAAIAAPLSQPLLAGVHSVLDTSLFSAQMALGCVSLEPLGDNASLQPAIQAIAVRPFHLPKCDFVTADP